MSGEIKISNVSKIFNQGETEEVTALNGVDFTIPAGSFVSLIGPSGCGKTTLLRCIAGLETPTSGEVSVDGSKITKPGSDRGFAFQQANLFPWLTIRDNVAFGLRARHIYKDRLNRTFPWLTNYQVSIPPGGRTDALVQTTISWTYNDRAYRTRALDADQTEAAIKATIKMLNIIENEE